MIKMNPSKRPSADLLLTTSFINETCDLNELADFIEQKKLETK